VAERLPARVGPTEVMGGSAIQVIERLKQCLKTADDLMANARRPEGTMRNAKLLLGTSEHLRRSLETATRIAEAMRQVD